MRKGDIELLEARIEPHGISIDRHNEAINELKRNVRELIGRVDTLERDRTSFALTMDQAANSVRSLLQQANRKLRDARMLIDTEEPLTDPPLETNTTPVSPAPMPTHHGRRVI